MSDQLTTNVGVLGWRAAAWRAEYADATPALRRAMRRVADVREAVEPLRRMGVSEWTMRQLLAELERRQAVLDRLRADVLGEFHLPPVDPVNLDQLDTAIP